MATRRRPDRKAEALREHGALNPRPRGVRDVLFQESEFFDARDLVQLKYEMLRRVRLEGQSVTRASGAFGLSRPSFYKARGDFDREGLPGLLPRKRGPRGRHKLTDAVMAHLDEQLAADPSLSAVTLAARIEEHLGLRVHPRSIERALGRREKKRR
jgi:transposase